MAISYVVLKLSRRIFERGGGRICPPPPSRARVKTYRTLLSLVAALRCSPVSREGHVCAPPPSPRPCEGVSPPVSAGYGGWCFVVVVPAALFQITPVCTVSHPGHRHRGGGGRRWVLVPTTFEICWVRTHQIREWSGLNPVSFPMFRVFWG